MTSFCLNRNCVLNLCADVVPQSRITLIANFLSMKILLSCFLVDQLVDICVFYGLNNNLL